MAVLHLNRCKNCRYWRGPQHHRECVVRLREEPGKGGIGKRLVPTTDRGPGTIEGPKCGQKTKPRDSCKHFTPKPLPYRKPRPAPPEAVGIVEAVETSPSLDVNLVDIGL